MHLVPEQMRASAGLAVDFLKVLANEDRLLLLCQISQAESSVGQLQEALDIQQPTLSQQLGVLRRSGLVNTRKEGKLVYYRLANDSVIAVMNTVYQQFCMKKEVRLS
ncbi:MAG: ArsR/SmtB family transcription factor [Azovibrio sp.]